MLYEVITVASFDCTFCANSLGSREIKSAPRRFQARSSIGEAGSRTARVNLSRITSYNVCYTKLLRLMSLHKKYNQNWRRREAMIDIQEQTSSPEPTATGHETPYVGLRVITSYSIHYTKLYDFPKLSFPRSRCRNF